MNHKIKFYKMHGLGNDFIIVNEKDFQTIVDQTTFIDSISDRRTGIGCDQFIVLS